MMNTTTNNLNLHELFQDSLSSDKILMIGTSVDTGFEWQAIDECKEKFNKDIKVVKERGKIYFNVHLDQLNKVEEMRSIDNIFIVGDVRKCTFNGVDKETDLQLFKAIVHNDMKLEKALRCWKHATGFLGKIFPTIKEWEEAMKTHKLLVKTAKCSNIPKGRKRGQNPINSQENDVLKYRVTCERSGKHTFESCDIARTIGGELQEKYHWLVDLSMYHLEIVCKVVESEMITHLRVTQESKHHRNIIYFGPTTLRSTICYNLLKLAHPNPGDIIMDPMCGSGSIPIEGALAYTSSYILCGDNHEKAIARSKANINTSISKGKIDLLQWDVSTIPLQNSCMDIVVTDMPFGKRSGKVSDNRVLYKEFLLQLGRIVKPTIGRLVLLTYDRRSFNLALQSAGNLFRVTKILGVNIGGLASAVYVLKRTDITYEQFQPRKINKHKRFKNDQNDQNDQSDQID